MASSVHTNCASIQYNRIHTYVYKNNNNNNLCVLESLPCRAIHRNPHSYIHICARDTDWNIECNQRNSRTVTKIYKLFFLFTKRTNVENEEKNIRILSQLSSVEFSYSALICVITIVLPPIFQFGKFMNYYSIRARVCVRVCIFTYS